MKTCPNCGAAVHDNAAFCTGCGANVPVARAPKKESVSVGGWIGRTLIPCIPLVGGIVYLIMLFIWSGDKKKEDTFRNWAKAQLIVMAIVLALTIVVAAVFGASIISMLEYM